MTCRARLFLAALTFTAACAVRAPAANESQIIFPGGSPAGAEAPVPTKGGSVGLSTLLGVLILAGAGGWMLWRGKKITLGGREAKLLEIAETRPLGNRQYLVVASYEGKKFLLGVCPGRIDLLAPLNGERTKGEAE